jgi:hypothetical protein
MGDQLTGIHLVAGRHVSIPRPRPSTLRLKLLQAEAIVRALEGREDTWP